MLFFTPHERRALIFIGAAFFCGVCLDLVFKFYPPGYRAMKILDEPPVAVSVDINRASYDELLTVKGIGPSTAARIIYSRQEKGRFSSVQELRAIKGFSPKMFNRAATRLTAGAP